MKLLPIPTQVIWNGVPFGFLRGAGLHLPVLSFSLSAGVKLEADHETGLTKVTGRELQTCQLTIRAMNTDAVDKQLSSNPRLVYEGLKLLKGMSGGIYVSSGVSATLTDAALMALQTSDWEQLLTKDFAVGMAKSLLLGTRMGGVDFMLTSVEMEATGIHPNGEIWAADITLTLTEDAEQRQTGGLKVFVNDKDITSSIAVHGCIYETHAEGCADTLEITFADTKKEWEGWQPSAKGDTVRITDGSLDSGKMFIDRIDPQDGKYTLRAASVPKSMFAVKSRSFEQMTLPRLAAKLASEHKLECKTYSVPEVPIAYLSQQGLSDVAFLQRQCDRAGCSFLVYNGALCVYAQRELEGREPSKTLTLGSGETCDVVSDAQGAYSSCELSNGTYTGHATDAAVSTGKTFRESVTATWASAADANSAAAARLRLLNKTTERAELEMGVQRKLAAGSVVRLVCSGWLGSAFLYRVRHNLLTKRSKIWARKPLTY